jgi:hypothetical protein
LMLFLPADLKRAHKLSQSPLHRGVQDVLQQRAKVHPNAGVLSRECA